MLVLETSLVLEAARWFDAPPQRLFDAWLHESWGEWLAPGAAWCTSSIVNPKVGGRYSLRMRMPDGRDMTVSGTYRQIVRPSRLAFTWAAGDYDEETLVSLAFEARHGGAELTLRQDGFIDAGLRDHHKAGWTARHGVLDKLARHLREYA